MGRSVDEEEEGIFSIFLTAFLSFPSFPSSLASSTQPSFSSQAMTNNLSLFPR